LNLSPAQLASVLRVASFDDELRAARERRRLADEAAASAVQAEVDRLQRIRAEARALLPEVYKAIEALRTTKPGTRRRGFLPGWTLGRVDVPNRGRPTVLIGSENRRSMSLEQFSGEGYFEWEVAGDRVYGGSGGRVVIEANVVLRQFIVAVADHIARAT
jgi:hypothetical protein